MGLGRVVRLLLGQGLRAAPKVPKSVALTSRRILLDARADLGEEIDRAVWMKQWDEVTGNQSDGG